MLSDPAQECIDAVCLTIEREATNGEVWVPSRLGMSLKRIFFTRARELHGLAHQSVRLVRLMEFAHVHGYTGFLYELRQLTKETFKNSCLEAQSNLQGIAAISPDSVQFVERNLDAQQGSFVLEFGQMARIAGYVDIVQNMLGYERVSEIVSPILGDPCRAKAADVAEALNREVVGWLNERLEREHLRKQADVLRRFLREYRIGKALDIKDDTISTFWADCGVEHVSIDGFRKFRNAANHMISYRHAMAAYEAEQAIAHSDALNGPDRDGGFVDLLERTEAADLEVMDWNSPLEALFSPPCNHVRWLTKSKRNSLHALLSDVESGYKEQPFPPLFLEHRPDPNLFRTLLRHSVFGGIQNKLIQALRDGNISRTEEESSYGAFQVEVEKIQEELLRVLKSSCFSLLQRNSLSGATLVEEIYPGSLKILATADTLKSVVAGGFDVGAFKDQLNKARPEVWNDLKKAYGGLNCLGFRDQDQTDRHVHLALVEGVENLIALRAQLTRLQAWCAQSDVLAFYHQDKRWFDQHFSRIYLQE